MRDEPATFSSSSSRCGYELGRVALAMNGKRKVEGFCPWRREKAEAVEADEASLRPRERAGPALFIRRARQSQPHPVRRGRETHVDLRRFR